MSAPHRSSQHPAPLNTCTSALHAECFNVLRLQCTMHDAEVIVEVGVGRARWVAVEPWAKPPEASCDNCIALCIGRPLVTRLLGPVHCCDAMHCMHCAMQLRENGGGGARPHAGLMGKRGSDWWEDRWGLWGRKLWVRRVGGGVSDFQEFYIETACCKVCQIARIDVTVSYLWLQWNFSNFVSLLSEILWITRKSSDRRNWVF